LLKWTQVLLGDRKGEIKRSGVSDVQSERYESGKPSEVAMS
jgi:hypothetical protein